MGEYHVNNRPSLVFYHANSKGTGCALSVKLFRADEERDGYYEFRLANQMTVGDRFGANPTLPTFDWDNSIDFNVGFVEVCKLLQVLRGETEDIDDGKGMRIMSEKTNTIFKFRHVIDHVFGYHIDVSQRASSGYESYATMLLSPAESLGLCEAIAGSIHSVVFGGR